MVYSQKDQTVRWYALQGPGTFSQAVQEALHRGSAHEQQDPPTWDTPPMQISSLHHHQRRPLADDSACLRPHRSLQDTLQPRSSAQPVTSKRSPLPVVNAQSLLASAPPHSDLSSFVKTSSLYYRIPNLKPSSEPSHDSIPTCARTQDKSSLQRVSQLPSLNAAATELHGAHFLPIVSPTPPPSAQTHQSGCLQIPRFMPSRGSLGQALSPGVKHRSGKQTGIATTHFHVVIIAGLFVPRTYLMYMYYFCSLALQVRVLLTPHMTCFALMVKSTLAD